MIQYLRSILALRGIVFFENSHVENRTRHRKFVPRRVSDAKSVNTNVCSN